MKGEKMEISYEFISKRILNKGVIISFIENKIPNTFLDKLFKRKITFKEFRVFYPIDMSVHLRSQMSYYPSGLSIPIDMINQLISLLDMAEAEKK
jgi:hypothetical protein